MTAARRAGKSGRYAAHFLLTALGVAAADQFTKWLVERTFRLGEGLVLVDGFVGLSYVRNPGVAFGLLADVAWRWRLPFFIIIAVVAAWLLYMLFREAGHMPVARAGMGMILGGAAGNLVDRLRYGMVVDFIDIGVGNYRWPTFNVADSCITVGTALIIIALWRAKKL